MDKQKMDGQKNNIQKMSRLFSEQKRDITNIYNSIFNKPLNLSSHIITNDVILNGKEVTNTAMVLKMKMGRFYEKLFCYLCNFNHLKKGFDLINEQEQIFIEIKANFLSDNYNARHSKFHLLGKYKTNNPTAKVYYICLTDKRQTHVHYTHHFGFQIITGTKAWQFFDLINFIRMLIKTSTCA